MGEIFSMFFDLFISLWGNIEAIFMPIINFIMWLAPLIVDVILNILEFIFGAIGAIIDGIKGILNFFGAGI